MREYNHFKKVKSLLNIILSTLVTIMLALSLVVVIYVLYVSLCMFSNSQLQWSTDLSTNISTLLQPTPSQAQPTTSQNTSIISASPSVTPEPFSIEYLERLNTIQNNTSNTNLIVFLYGFLCSIFVGLGAYYVDRSRKNCKKVETEAERISKKITASKDYFDREALNLKNQIKEIADNQIRISTGSLESSTKIQVYEIISVSLCIYSILVNVETVLAITYFEGKEKQYNVLSRLLPKLNEMMLRLDIICLKLQSSPKEKADLLTIMTLLDIIQTSLRSLLNKSHILPNEYIHEQISITVKCVENISQVADKG